MGCGGSTASNKVVDEAAVVPGTDDKRPQDSTNKGKEFLRKGEGQRADTAGGVVTEKSELEGRAKKREQASLSLREQIRRDKEEAARKKRENGGEMPASPANKVVTKDGDLTATDYN